VASQLTQRGSQQQIAELNLRVGADQEFNEKKHGYVLTFPWNFEEVLSKTQTQYPTPFSESSYWNKWLVNTRTINDLNVLFREFHQYCAIPDYQGLSLICEPRLASYVSESLKRIHFHGLDVEMANLTVEQPSIKVLKAEVHDGLKVDRSQNLDLASYKVFESSLLGAKWNKYVPKDGALDRRHVMDVLDTVNHRPYLVQLTCLIESPMKLYVFNQNRSAILFGSEDEETVQNVVKVEANVRWFDFLNLLPVENKKIASWKITDFNNVLDENPLFQSG
jgi:hypothetical protein